MWRFHIEPILMKSFSALECSALASNKMQNFIPQLNECVQVGNFTNCEMFSSQTTKKLMKFLLIDEQKKILLST